MADRRLVGAPDCTRCKWPKASFNDPRNESDMSAKADNDNLQTAPDQAAAEVPPRKPLTEAAKRALAEAEERRNAERKAEPAPEIGGRGGADPARFGDWEIKGRAIDF